MFEEKLKTAKDNQPLDPLSLDRSLPKQPSEMLKPEQPTLSPELCRDLITNIAIAINTLNSGRWKKESHYQDARGEALNGYLNPGTNGYFIIELAKLRSFSAPRAPALTGIFERFRQLDFDDTQFIEAIDPEEREAFEKFQTEAFEEDSLSLLKSEPELDQHIKALSTEVFALLKDTSCFKLLYAEYEKPLDERCHQTIRCKLDEVSALALASFAYIRLTLDLHKDLNQEGLSANFVNQLIAVGCFVKLLNSFPNHEMTEAVADHAVELCNKRFNPGFCNVISDTFVYCATRIISSCRIVESAALAVSSTRMLDRLAQVVSLITIPEPEEVSYPHFQGLIRLILRVEGERDSFISFKKLGPNALDIFSLVKGRDQFNRVEAAAIPSNTHGIILEAVFGLRNDMSVVPNISAALAPICDANDSRAQQLVRLRAYLYRFISDLSQRESELFANLQSDCSFTILINKTNILVMPPRKLQEVAPAIFDEKYHGVPLAKTDLSLVTVGPPDDLVYVLPLEKTSDQDEELVPLDFDEPENEPIQEAHPERYYKAQVRKALRARYPTFQTLLKELLKHGAELSVSRGKGSHALIQREGKVALVSRKVYDETGPLKHLIAISILEDLGFSCKEALEWL